MAFNLPVQNYFTRTTGPSIWTRPADWPVITDAVNEVQFLVSDQGDSNCSIQTNFTRTSGSQNIIIDWGDSTTTTVTTTTSTTSNHNYTPGSGTPCSLGYTTFKIRVYFSGTGVSTLNTCSIGAVYLTGNSYTSQICYVLEAYYGNGTVPGSPPSFYSSPVNVSSIAIFTALKYVKHPSSVNWTNIQNIFYGATSLARVVLPTSMSSATLSNNMFQNCYELEEVTFPSNATGLTSLQSMFQNCYNLQKVTLPTSLNSCTTFISAFNTCVNLKNLTIPSVNNCNDFSSSFANCYQLEWVKFTSMPTTAITISFSSTFSACTNLQTVYFPTTGGTSTTYTFSLTFSSCVQLKNIVFPSNINISSLSNAFNSCASLTSCILPTSCPSLTTMVNCFSSCYSLRTVTLPTTVGSSISLSGTFGSCYKLETITIPSTWNINNMASTFANCAALKTLNWTPGALNSLTNLSQAFSGCRGLTSVNLPTSMTSLTTLNSTFNACAIETVTFPTSLNAVTTISGIFLNCVNLKSITFPTSMSSCTDLSQAFQNCYELRSVTFPNTISASATTFAATFLNCYSIETVVFPGAAQLSLLNSISSLFSYSSNLKTITNFDKMGSLTSTPLLDASTLTNNRFTSISFVAPLSVLTLNGLSGVKTDVQSVRLLNTSAGQWTGTSPQINVSYTNMSTANLVQLFNDMAAQGVVVGKTINITSATGAAALTAADRLIVTSKGWTITG